MDLTEDAFRALAQSSPWRWRTLHFTHEHRWGAVEAWVRRPGLMLVRDSGGRDHLVDERDAGRSVFVAVGTGASAPPRMLRPHEVEPVWRDDGLVGVRPDPARVPVEYDDPMWQSYDWVAMLDPVELSHHTTIADLREGTRLGRRTWWARMAAEDGYEPRCGCCPLLWSYFSDRDEYGPGDEDPLRPPPAAWAPRPGTVYPEAYDVALDVQTGVVVELAPTTPGSHPTGHRLEVLEVDADLSAVLGPVS